MLTTEQVQQAVEFYLKRTFTQYAVMIDGGWGVGKTHLLNQFILPAIPGISYFHISLYGLSTMADIENEIYKSVSIEESHLASDAFNDGPFNVQMHRGAKLGGVSYAVQFLIKKFQSAVGNKARKLVLCFDDLERWNGDLDVCLAYINKLVEQENVKCILLGNTNAFNEIALQKLSKAREKSIRHIYKFENTVASVINIALKLIDYQSDSSRDFLHSLVNNNRGYLTTFMERINDKNIRTLSEALQLYEYIYTRNEVAFKRSERIAFTYLLTLLSTLILLKKHFVNKKERRQLLDGNYHDNKGFGLLKKIGYFDQDAPAYINAESRILLDTIFYRLDEISLRGVFSIIENGFYVAQDFNGNFNNWNDEKFYEVYLDKLFFYQLEEDQALKILNQIIHLIFEDQSITNPATLLLLAERILTDIQRDVIDMDMKKTKQKFIDLVNELYDSRSMDVMEMEFLKIREQRYPNSNDIFKLVLELNAVYVRDHELRTMKSFWNRLGECADDMDSLIQEYANKQILCAREDIQSALQAIESLNNSQLNQLAHKLLERNNQSRQNSYASDDYHSAQALAESLLDRYKNKYGIRASNIKDIANLFNAQIPAPRACLIRAY